ncbi:MAG: hypothetical protein OXE78_01645 [Gammaproteobacteria bacterium]|nr:hypothetical protein [Gammaproteobacteria bacterium]MCY4357331.1 hypothetical protein [Gammaproteobacteria bacterium]
MNQTMNQWQSPPLIAAAEYFAANPKNLVAPTAASNADILVDSMLKRHCAGMRRRVTGSMLREALLTPPELDGEVAEAIRWLFGSIWIQDLHKLAWRCGIPIVHLAEHTRVSGTTNRHLITWLNQFSTLNLNDSDIQ